MSTSVSAGSQVAAIRACPVRSWARDCPWNYGNQAAENVSSSRFHDCNLLLPDSRLYYYSSIINKIGTIKKKYCYCTVATVLVVFYFTGGYYYHCDCYFFLLPLLYCIIDLFLFLEPSAGTNVLVWYAIEKYREETTCKQLRVYWKQRNLMPAMRPVAVRTG